MIYRKEKNDAKQGSVYQKSNAAILSLLYGQVNPRESSSQKSIEYKLIFRTEREEWKKLAETMNSEQINLLEQYDKLIDELFLQARDGAYVSGFKLGMRLGIESMENDE